MGGSEKDDQATLRRHSFELFDSNEDKTAWYSLSIHYTGFTPV